MNWLLEDRSNKCLRFCVCVCAWVYLCTMIFNCTYTGYPISIHSHAYRTAQHSTLKMGSNHSAGVLKYLND